MKNCTCGVKFTGGLHSSWCDTLAPDEPEPDTLPSPYVDLVLYEGQWLVVPAGAVFIPPTP
jgi:hypothetical protein